MSETIIVKIKESHQIIRKLFEETENEKNIEIKKDLYLQLKSELNAHMESEERTIYKHLTEDVGDEEAENIAHDAFDEHEQIRETIEELDKHTIENPRWKKMFENLKNEFIDHQLKEEISLFAEVREEFSKQELIEFGEEFEEVKIEHFS
jgi:iron-sulfur cluster repair protein YtfE (RIC family)